MTEKGSIRYLQSNQERSFFALCYEKPVGGCEGPLFLQNWVFVVHFSLSNNAMVGLLFPSVHCAQSRPHREGGQRGVRLHLHHQGAGDWDVHHGDEQFLKYKR